MAEEEKDFCTGVKEREEHCGCMRVSECANLAAKVVVSYRGRVPVSIKGHQEYVSKKNVHELLDRLSQSVTKTEEGV
jgi:hypothetical protein